MPSTLCVCASFPGLSASCLLFIYFKNFANLPNCQMHSCCCIVYSIYFVNWLIGWTSPSRTIYQMLCQKLEKASQVKSGALNRPQHLSQWYSTAFLGKCFKNNGAVIHRALWESMGKEYNLSYRCKKRFQKCHDEWVTCVFQEKNHREIMGQGKGRSMRRKINWEEP